MRTLVIPPAAQRDINSIQMLSAWVAENELHCTLNVGMWEDHGHNEPKAWGILLADVVRHIASAIQDKKGISTDVTIDVIVASLKNELESPTSKIKGGFSPGHT